MKRWLVLLIVVMTVLLGLCGAAQAADNPVKVSVQLSKTEFTGPENVDVSIQIKNAGDRDLPAPMKLYAPDGSQIEEFGEPVLAAGTTHSWSGTIALTSKELDEGKITFRLLYSIWDDDGNPVDKTSHFSKPITYSGGKVSLEVNRSITPTSAGNGQKVTVTYELINTGTVEITDVVITENKAISSKPATIERVGVGEKVTHKFTVTMGKKALTSKSEITYKAAGETFKVTKEAATVKYGEVKLKATLEADKKGGTPGETVTIKLTLKNSGKQPYNDLVITDPALGEVFTVDTVEAGKTVTLEKTLTLTDSMNLQFTVKGVDASGDDMETVTDQLPLTVIGSDQLIDLHVEAAVDSSTVYGFPAIVKFRVYVTNNSTVDVTKVSVSASGKTLYTFPLILSGETREFTRDVQIEMAGQYQFVASCRDQLNQSQSFDSNIVRIMYSAPTPVPTEVPIAAPVMPTQVPVPSTIDNRYVAQQTLLGNIGRVCLIIAIVFGLLSVAGIAIRAVVAVKRKAAIDSLDDRSVRDYEHGMFEKGKDMDDEVTVRRDDTDPDPEDLLKPSAQLDEQQDDQQ